MSLSHRMKKQSVATKLYVLAAFCMLAFVGYATYAWNTLSIAKVHGPYYNRIVQGKDLIADILPPPNYIIESYMMALHMANEVDEGVDAATMDAYVDRCGQLKAEFDDRHSYWVADLPEGEMKQIKTVDCFEPAVRFYDVLFNDFVPACQSGQADKAQGLARGVLREHYETHRASIDKVVAMATEDNAQAEAEVGDIVAARATWSACGIGLGMTLIFAFTWYTARQTVRPLVGSASQLQVLSCQDLPEVSERIRRNAEATTDQATMASGAAQEVSANAQSLSIAVEQFEESIKEIASNASNAASVARQAVDATNSTNETITRLGESSGEIGNVIKVINSIAEQTNLLALNATIEAARAGEAGKGFAVVANEVKELAKETGKATEDIVRRIETIQTDTQEAVDAIGLVSEVITQINESQSAIAGAVEEQTAMTSEISRNISEVASGSSHIATNITKVAESTKVTTQSSDETMATAQSIQHLASELLSLVGQSTDVETTNTSSSTSTETSTAGKYQLSS